MYGPTVVLTSHRATWNGVPLSIGEWTIGDDLRPANCRVGSAGKARVRADVEAVSRPSHTRDTGIGLAVS